MPTKRTALLASVLTLFLVGLSPLPALLAATSTGSNLAPTSALNPVQVSIQTKNLTSVGSYDLVAYNSTGAQVASYMGQYSQVTLQLPAGTFLLAANANGQQNRAYYPPCYGKGAGVSSPPPQAGNVAQGAGAAIAYPCCCYSNPPSEYGYALVQVSGSSTVNINTQAPSTLPTTSVSVSISYKNGTAVSDAYVYANVVGAYWYWGDNSRLTMYGQTGRDGVAHLTVPAVPLAVTASKSVKVDIPKSETTTQVNIGGQVVNVTIYYSPTYVYETATALLIPPTNSLRMVLTAQQGYPVIPYAAGVSAGAPGQAIPGAQGGLPPNSAQGQVSQGAPGGAQSAPAASSATSTNQMASIPPLPADLHVSTQASPTAPTISLLTLGTLALAGAIAAVVGIGIAKTRH